MVIPLINTINLQDFTEIIKPLIIFMMGLTIYSLFIFRFYKFVATKKIFELNLKRYNNSKHPIIEKFLSFIFYIIENILFMPVLIFFWFIIFAAMITFLSKTNDIETMLLISAALVGAIRITAYYSEDLSKDLSKLIPFVLLGIFLVDISYFSIEESFTKLLAFAKYGTTIFYYLIFIVLLEFVIRISFSLLSAIGIKFEKEKNEDKE